MAGQEPSSGDSDPSSLSSLMSKVSRAGKEPTGKETFDSCSALVPTTAATRLGILASARMLLEVRVPVNEKVVKDVVSARRNCPTEVAVVSSWPTSLM